jgi:hypothetical protein
MDVRLSESSRTLNYWLTDASATPLSNKLNLNSDDESIRSILQPHKPTNLQHNIIVYTLLICQYANLVAFFVIIFMTNRCLLLVFYMENELSKSEIHYMINNILISLFVIQHVGLRIEIAM